MSRGSESAPVRGPEDCDSQVNDVIYSLPDCDLLGQQAPEHDVDWWIQG